jgi:hypothetical protein
VGRLQLGGPRTAAAKRLHLHALAAIAGYVVIFDIGQMADLD